MEVFRNKCSWVWISLSLNNATIISVRNFTKGQHVPKKKGGDLIYFLFVISPSRLNTVINFYLIFKVFF